MRILSKNRENGFTLIELLIAMALTIVIIAALSNAFISQRKTYAVQVQVSEMTQNARAAIDMITREIKMAGFAPTGYDETATVPPFPKMQRKDSTVSSFVGIPYNATQLQIIADLNGDGETDGTTSDDDANEEIIYTYNPTDKQIERNTGDGNKIFSENIDSFSFKYFKKDGNGEVNSSAEEGDIRQIEITITATTDKPDPNYGPNSGYRSYTVTSRVSPTNLDL